VIISLNQIWARYLTLAAFAGLLAIAVQIVEAQDAAQERADPSSITAPTAAAARGAPPDPARKPTAEDRSSRATARAKGDLTFDDIKFAIEKGVSFERSMLTQEIEALNKKSIRIRGYILPASVFKQSGIEKFVLVRDNQECCFGPGAALYDCIMIEMVKGKTAEFTTRPIAVKGKFEVEEFKFPDGTHYAIYKLTASEAK